MNHEHSTPEAKEAKGFFNTLFDLSFSSFITSQFIKVIYILAVGLMAIGLLFQLGVAVMSGQAMNILLSIVLTPIIFLLGVVGIRIWCELVIVIFRIAENTREMADRQ